MQNASVIRQFFRAHRVETLLFFAFWIAFGYFFHLRPGWGVNTRLDLTFALVDRGTFAIDAYCQNPLTETGDVAEYGGHFYCDKSPALSLLAIPFYAIAKPLFAGLPPEARIVYLRQWCTVWAVGLLGALAAALFYRLMRLFGATGEEGLALTFFLIYGTNLGGYTSLFFPYLPGMACLIGAYVLLLGPRQRGEEIDGWRAAAIGFLISMAGFFEFTFALAGAVMLILVLATMRPRKRFLWTILAALPPVLALFSYNYALFNDFALAYAREVDPRFRAGMAQGFMGITYPNLSVLYYLTIHPFKGIFFYSPILLCFFLGSLWTKRLGARRADLAAAWAILIGYLLFNASYEHQWWGGWSMGPRHLIGMLPFLFMPILAAMRRHPRMRGMVMLAGGVSFLLCLAPIVVDPQIPAGYADAVLINPLFPPPNLTSVWLTQVIPALFQGQVALTPFSFLPHALPLAPLAIFWILVLWKAWRWGEEEE